MGNTFEQIIEIVDNLQFTIKEADNLAQIEKDILLQKLRDIYAGLDCPPAVIQPQIEPIQVQSVSVDTPQPAYKVHEGVAEDVDLFFEVADDPTEIEEPAEIQEPAAIEVPAEIKEPVKIEVPAATTQPEPSKPSVVRPQTVSDEDEILQFSFAENKVKQVVQPIVEEQPKVVVEPLVVEEQPKPQPAQPQPMVTPQPQRSVNDMFSEKSKDNSLGSQFQHAKVADLTKSISVNDKFAFIKELFNNKGEEYSKAIQELNQCGNIEAAFDCLEIYKNKFFWDSTSNAYLTLCDLLRRKYQ